MLEKKRRIEKSTLKNFRKSAGNVDEWALQIFCIVFAAVGIIMCGVNLAVSSYRMACITGGIGLSMLISLVALKCYKNKVIVVINITVIIMLMMLYFLVNGGENGFSSIWMLLVPPVAVCFLSLYYGGLFSIVLGIVTAVYMWTPLHELGFAYTNTYITRFPIVYFSDMVICLIIEYQVWSYRKRQEELLRLTEEANRAKTNFLANMSHEVRTPINAVLGYNEMIMRETGESHTAEYALNIQAAGKTLLSITRDILDYTEIEGGNLKLDNVPYSVLSLLQDIRVYALYNSQKKNLQFEMCVDDKLPQELIGDMGRILQICNNLLSNAIKYTKEGSVFLNIEWEQICEKKGNMHIQVEDTGIGMQEEDIKRIADSFIRFDDRKTRNVQGLGLGLSIVTRLLNQMNSSLEIESVYGEGSCFSFSIEQEVINEEGIGNIEWEKNETFLLGVEAENGFVAPDARILVADDNIMNLDLLKGILKNTRIQIDTAINGKEALQLLEKYNYHIIFLDHMMPVLDGIETLREIKTGNLCEGTPIVALTANAIAGAKEGYLKEGFDDYLSKPIESHKLERLVEAYLPKELVIRETNHPVMEEVLQDGRMNFLERLSFLHTDIGMTYCCNSEEFYKEMLSSYFKNSRFEDIKHCYEQEDWENYRIQVHALKSTSLSIGAEELSNAAKQLEDAAKAEDITYIHQHHEKVLKTYSELLLQIQGVIEQEQEDVSNTKDTKKTSHILVVDDDSMNLRIAEKMLAGTYQVSTVKSGGEALEFLNKEMPNLILLDLHMPQMDGFQVMEEIGKQENLSDIPIVLLTADNDRETEIKGFQKGAQDFITKPFVADIMLQRVNRILELDRLRKNLQQEVDKQTAKAEERRRKVERMSLQVMQTLASTIDAKDKYTNGHSVRVAEYSRALAKRLGKSERYQEDIYHMGLLHDIGKIGVPDEIINKAGKLTDEEYKMIKSHPTIGGDILKNISEMPGIEIGAKWHHERYDGYGYPDRLKGEEIPEAARIIGVADAYDAMASKRSYRDVLPQEVVRAEIEKGRGTQFDPDFADAFIELIDEDVEYRMREVQ